jgi:nickel-dependent lactate racemase
MVIRLLYGNDGHKIHLSDKYHIDIIEPQYIAQLDSPTERIRQSLQEPYESTSLKGRIAPNETVGIILSDITRPVPSKTILPIILDELSHVKTENISLFNGLGSHRPNTAEEIRTMVGSDIVARYQIIQNEAFNKSTLRHCGQTSKGHEIYINDELASCDHLILTGFIEPHFFAGFSGGGKAILPGMAGMSTILDNHGPKMIADPNSAFGITAGNPIWEEITEVGQKFQNTFLVNVALNKNKEITGVFSGNLLKAHASGCSYVKDISMVPVSDPYDIVITTNSGYPLDINLYQSVKGMSAAARIVKKGGSIIIAAECRDGIPEYGCYGSLLKQFGNPEQLLESIMTSNEIIPDQWQAQIQAQILLSSDIYVYSEKLASSHIESALLKPCNNIEKTVEELIQKYGSETRICILPEGPQTIPFLE